MEKRNLIPVDSEPLYRDGRHYDLQHKNFDVDIPFYLSMVDTYKSPILELACGTGRLTLPIAGKGNVITGIDVSEGMILRAREKAQEQRLKAELIKSDVRDFDLNKKFNLIIFPFNSIAHLHDLESINACFKAVRKHLNDQGRFILDFYNPRLDMLIRDTSTFYPVAEYPDPDSNEKVVISEKNKYDAATQINHIKWHYKIGKREFINELNMRIFYPQELDALLTYNGFDIETKYGDFDKSTFVSESPKQIIISSPTVQ